MTLQFSQGLVFPVAALPGMGRVPAAGNDGKEVARVFYLAATRAKQRLVIGMGENVGFSTRLRTLTGKPANEVS